MVLLAAIAAAAHAADGPPAPLRFDEARFVLSESETPPPDGAPSEVVPLTDLWREQRPDAQGRGWYRFDFDLAAVPDERWAVYLPGLASNAAVFANGEFLGDGGRMREPVALNSNRPLLFSMSPRVLRAGANRIDVALFAYRDSWDRLEPILVGAESVLAPRFERQHFWDVDVARFATALVIALLLFVGAIWIGADRDPVYGWFLATGIFWAVASFNYHIRDLPVPFHTWERLVNLCLAATAISAVFLAHRLLGIAPRRRERALVILGASALGTLALTPIGSLQQNVRLLHLVDVGLVAYACWVVARHRRLLERREIAIFLAGATGFFAIAAHDAAIQFGALPLERPRLLPLGGPVILLTFASYLTARFVRATRRHNAELAARLREREAELAVRYQQMAELERDRVLSRERSRILREVHDGMGGKIVSSLALLETRRAPPERVAATLRDSLDDMRLLMHSLHPDAGDLEALLATLRERLEGRLDGAGVRIEWRPGDLPEGLALSPEQSHHVTRILEEAFTNVIKHAGARVVRVATEFVGDATGGAGVSISVRDDGQAGTTPSGAGFGLGNMRERARAAGGSLEIESSDAGTEIRLWLPLRGMRVRNAFG